MQETNRNDEGTLNIDLVGMALSLVDHWRIVALLTAAFLVFGGGYSVYKYNKMSGRGYQAIVRLAVESVKPSFFERMWRVTPADTRIQEAISIGNSGSTKMKALDAAGISMSANEMSGEMTAAREASTRYINLTVRAQTANDAVRLANEFAIAICEIDEAVRGEAVLTVAVKAGAPVRVVDERDANGIPAGWKSVRNTVLFCGVLGLALGCFIAIGFFLLDTRVRSAQEITRETGLSVAAMLPTIEEALAEGSDVLAARLKSAAAAGAKVTVITGCRDETDSGFVAALLLRSLENIECRAVLLDADLVGSTLTNHLDIPEGGSDVTAYLSGDGEPSAAVRQANGSGMAVAPVITKSERMLPLVCGERFGRLIDYLRDKYDVILVNAPQIDPSGAAAEIASCCDAALIVAAPGRVTRMELRGAADTLGAADCRVLGVVLSGAMCALFSDRVYYMRAYYKWVQQKYGRNAARMLYGGKLTADS